VKTVRWLTGITLLAVTVSCTPQVAIQAPDKPITINLNIKLDAEVRVKLEETAKKDISANPNIF
jgi:hypothetical protein